MKAKQLTVFTLAMFITGSIDSIRNMPAASLFGSTLIFFFIFAAILFLIPTALISSELSATHSDHGGVYGWVRLAFGDACGFVAVWLQWINTMIWYPTILSFLAATLAYLIDPHLADNKFYLVSVILLTFWGMTFLNLRGIQTSARFASVCAIIGMIVPMILILTLGVIWIVMGHPIHIHITWKNIWPSFHHAQNWIALTAIITSFLGMELATVHIKDIENPQRKFPRALLISVIIILVTMIFGSLVIAFVLPKNQISLVAGVMEVIKNLFRVYHVGWLVPVIATLIIIGGVGGMVNWIISPARGLMQAAQTGFLPKYFCVENRYGVANRLLIAQAILVSLACVAFLFVPSVNGSYWLLTDLSTQVYLFMYVLMFIAALRLRHKFDHEAVYFRIPGGILGIWLVGLLGLLGCSIAIFVGFIPPENINVGGALHYELLFAGGIVVLLLPTLFFILQKQRNT